MSENSDRYFEGALTAIRAHDYDRAAGLLVEVIKLKPDFYEAWVVRGNVLHACERHFDALLHYDRALAIDDTLHDAWNNRGIAFADIGMWGEAEKSFRRSAELLPALEPHMGLANMFCTLMRLPEAADEYRKAIEFGAGPDARFNLGVTLLGQGQWEEGFREYEHRWLNTPYPPRAYRKYPKWRGEDLNGKRVVLYPEQGYGDEILGVRFADVLKWRYPDATIILMARPPMYRLIQDIADVTAWPINMDTQPQDVSYSCPLLDVPMVLGLKPDDVTKGSYLMAPDMEMVGTWIDQLPEEPISVGLCWSSGGHLNTARAAQQAKSIPLHWLKPLIIEGVNFVSLQKPATAIPDGFPIDMGPIEQCHDFADTAALIEALDLVISVDTAVAHLAGAMGKPVWNFVRYSGYWPWLTAEAVGDPERSIWYPSMKLLRQPSLANWQEPIERATKMLADLVKKDAA